MDRKQPVFDFLNARGIRYEWYEHPEAQTGQGKQQDGKQLCVQYGMEQPRRAVEVQKDSVHHTDVHAPQPDDFVTEPVHVHNH